jgi:hypothetical protein
MSLVTLDTIKDWLGITGAGHDDVLTIIQSGVEQAVLNYTESKFELTVVTHEILDGNLSDIVVTRNMPIHSVQALYFNCEPDGSNGSLVDPSDYNALPEAIILRGIDTPFGRSVVRVDYTYGYDGVPGDVSLAIIQAVEAEFRRKGRKSIGMTSRSKRSESEGLSGDMDAWDSKTGLPKEVVSKLNPYRVFEWPNQPMATRNK